MTPLEAEHERDVAKGREFYWRFKIAKLRRNLTGSGTPVVPTRADCPGMSSDWSACRG